MSNAERVTLAESGDATEVQQSCDRALLGVTTIVVVILPLL